MSDVTPGEVRPSGASPLVFTIPAALAGGALAGALETSSVSFLPVMAERGELVLDSTAALFGFGLGGTLLQAPLGWMADKVGFKAAQLITAGAVLGSAGGAAACSSAAPMLSVLLFMWGGAAGGMNTLAVIEAGTTVHPGDTSRAMTAVALSYTLGGIMGPVATGLAEAEWPGQGLSIAASAFTAIFLALRFASR
jgi:MFS family permease